MHLDLEVLPHLHLPCRYPCLFIYIVPSSIDPVDTYIHPSSPRRPQGCSTTHNVYPSISKAPFPPSNLRLASTVVRTTSTDYLVPCPSLSTTAPPSTDETGRRLTRSLVNPAPRGLNQKSHLKSSHLISFQFISFHVKSCQFMSIQEGGLINLSGSREFSSQSIREKKRLKRGPGRHWALGTGHWALGTGQVGGWGGGIERIWKNGEGEGEGEENE
ncbi:hypothetical protein EYC84_004828 [Monilinia fructicola]|uniref:Uncharacterized protein n=1 Tax=Monilinia fructicola TaxID=38448 RepID=A0A5M9K696_MONFR|nr:hypothetical protein EYC84_004828 [Monilinia fructicola]